jgi:hypothetical protein
VRTPVADGMSEIWMLLPDTGATTFMTAIDASPAGVAQMMTGPLINAAPMPPCSWR